MKKESSKQQLIIVLWKWDNLTKVNANSLSKEEFEMHIANITQGRGVYYEELTVENSPICKNPLFVQVNIYNDNEQTHKLFLAVLQQYIQPGNEVLLFLHRANFYGEKEVSELRKSFEGSSLKCFLFSDARDYIYYSTKNSGLLNETGGFYAQRDISSGEFTRTFDRKTKSVKQPYFDRVWLYYREEFQTKVFMLKQELFDAWFPLMLPDQPGKIDKSQLLALLSQNKDRLLIERVNSFIGRFHQEDQYPDGTYEANSEVTNDGKLEKINAVNTALNKIAHLERHDGQSYLFDDFVANFQYEADSSTTISVFYLSIRASLIEFLSNGDGLVSKAAMRSLAQQFNNLIQALPGNIS